MSELFDPLRRLTARFVVCLLLSLALIVLELNGSSLGRVRAGLMALVAPVQYLVGMPTTVLGRGLELVVSHNTLRARNAKLEDELRELRFGMQRFDAMRRENERLRRLLGSATEQADQLRGAELIAVESTPRRQFVVIDKGSRHGVFAGQPVVDADGVMGQVVHVGPFTATTMLVTDTEHAVPVRIDRTGLRAIARGQDKKRTLALNFVPSSADVREGDVLVTSGLGGTFPEGYVVGTVERIDNDPGNPFARIEVTPTAQLESAREVLLVWPTSATASATRAAVGRSIPAAREPQAASDAEVIEPADAAATNATNDAGPDGAVAAPAASETPPQ